MHLPQLRLLQHFVLIEAIVPADQVSWNPPIIDHLVEHSPAATSQQFNGIPAKLVGLLSSRD